MMQKYGAFICVCCFSIFMACAQTRSFTEAALDDTFLSVNGATVSFREILEKHRGKPVLIDVWATWCKDCIVGMPELKKMMGNYPAVEFVFLSLDKGREQWEKGIKKYGLANGTHYYSENGWKSDFFTSIELDWIPRYMLLDGQGNIIVYRAIKADDTELNIQLKQYEK